MKFLTQLPGKLSLAILAALGLGKVLDLAVISFFYTISCAFIEVLLFLLPVMVFGFIFRALLSMKKGSLSLLFSIFAGVTASNCLALFVAYLSGALLLPHLGLSQSTDLISCAVAKVLPLFQFHLPTLIGTETAMISGVILGIVVSKTGETSRLRLVSERFSLLLNKAIHLFLDRVFTPFLPLYVFSFCLKLCYEGALTVLFQQYGKVFLLSMAIVIFYIGLLYLIGAKGNWKEARYRLLAMMPAGLTGFSTMSSAATMPVTLACVEKTTKDKNFTNLVVPSTANIHMLGDDLTIMITSMTILSVFGVPWPDLVHFFPFAIAFSLAKLSCVGIPGASVLVVLPVLQSYLGFSPEMVSILTTIYVLQDPFGTAANVMGNGAFALLIQRLFKLDWRSNPLSQANKQR